MRSAAFTMLLQQRRAIAGKNHGQISASTTCIEWLPLPHIALRRCVEMVAAISQLLWRQGSQARDCWKIGSLVGKKDLQGKVLAGCKESFAEERTVWLRALLNFFREQALLDLLPLVWCFLDDHPTAIRLFLHGGYIWDLALRPTPAVLPDEFPVEVLDPSTLLLGLLDQGQTAVHRFEHALVFADLEDRLGRIQVLRGHEAFVTCFSVGEDGLVATGGFDQTVRVWDGSTCIHTFTNMEWSEGRTIIIGHVTTITAVLILPGGLVASGDDFGEICVWGGSSGCSMLYPAASSAVTCLATGSEDGHFLVGHADGELRLIDLAELSMLATWSDDSKGNDGHSGSVLAIAGMDRSGCVAAVACNTGLFQAWHDFAELSKVTAFAEPAISASFDEGGFLVACGHNHVSLLTLDGRICFVVNAPGVRCAAPLWQHDRRTNSAVKEPQLEGGNTKKKRDRMARTRFSSAEQ